MNKPRQIIVCLPCFLGVIRLTLGAARAQTDQQQGKPPTADQLEQLQLFQRAQELLGTMKTTLEHKAKSDLLQCQRAIGHNEFCECLTKNLPIVVSFSAYISMLTSTKVDLNYGQLTSKQQLVVDKTLAARDQCVTTVFGE
jgi:hypothetical protein